jgi:hypothetical protein
MNPHRRFWDELLIAVEEALAAFSGARPGVVAQPPVPAKTDCGNSNRFSFAMGNDPYAQDSTKPGNPRKGSTRGGEEAWQAGCS